MSLIAGASQCQFVAVKVEKEALKSHLLHQLLILSTRSLPEEDSTLRLQATKVDYVLRLQAIREDSILSLPPSAPSRKDTGVSPLFRPLSLLPPKLLRSHSTQTGATVTDD